MHSNQSSYQRGLWFLTGTSIFLAGIAGFIVLKGSRAQPVVQARPEKIPLVRTVPVEFQQGPLSVSGKGVVRPRAEITLSSQVSGQVRYINPNLVTGGEFDAGEVLLQLDRRNYENALAQARAEKKTTLAKFAFTNKQIERVEKLVKKGSVSEEELDRFVSQKKELLGTLDLQEARIAQAQLELGYTTIKAPFQGRVHSEKVDIGEYVTPGQELARLFTVDEAEITVELNDGEAGLIPGLWENGGEAGGGKSPAVITTRYGNHDYSWEGYVHRTEASINSHTRTVNVVVRIPNPTSPGTPAGQETRQLFHSPPPLTVGMYVTADIRGIQLDRYITVPRSALRDNNSLWIAAEDGTLSIQEITVVQEDDGLVKLIGPGLEEGMRIITSSLPTMTDGMRVMTVNVDPSPAGSQGYGNILVK